jgi:small redox-active disulfide protein 2
MKKIQILGTGCPKCKALFAATEAAAKSSGIDFTIEKVTDLGRIASFGVMATPTLVVDGEVKIVGKVPSSDEIKQMLV